MEIIIRGVFQRLVNLVYPENLMEVMVMVLIEHIRVSIQQLGQAVWRQWGHKGQGLLCKINNKTKIK